MEAHERLEKIMADYSISASEFGRKIGKPDNFVSTIRIGATEKLSPKVVRAIVEAFPEYSPDWLRTGEPPIYSVEAHRVSRSIIGNGNTNNNNVTDTPDRLLTLMEGQTAALLSQLERKDEQINRLLTLLEGRRDG